MKKKIKSVFCENQIFTRFNLAMMDMMDLGKKVVLDFSSYYIIDR